MTQQSKTQKLQIKTTDKWLKRVRKAAQNADTTVSEFVRQAVNARMQEQEQQPKAA